MGQVTIFLGNATFPLLDITSARTWIQMGWVADQWESECAHYIGSMTVTDLSVT